MVQLDGYVPGSLSLIYGDKILSDGHRSGIDCVGREQTITTIADSLGLVLHTASDRAEQLIAALHAKQLLLVLDNFEHLQAEASCVALIGDLVRGAPRVKLLVTSREPLRLQAEWVVELGGLGVPATDSGEEIAHAEAVLLFLERARRANSAFRLGLNNQAAAWRFH